MASGKTTGTDEISPDLTRHCKAALLLLLHSAAGLQGREDHNPQQELQQLQRHLLSHHRRTSICLDHLDLPTDHDHQSENEERPPSSVASSVNVHQFKYFPSTRSNGGSAQNDGKKDGSVQSLCHQHIAIQQTDVDHTIQETRLNTLHLRSIQPPWSTNLARQCPTSKSFPALAFLAFTHPTRTTQSALAVSKTEQEKALDINTESWRQLNSRGEVLCINSSRRSKRRKAADKLAPERNAITPKDLRFSTGVAIATETVTSIVVSLTT